jgi:hypothetical protein
LFWFQDLQPGICVSFRTEASKIDGRRDARFREKARLVYLTGQSWVKVGIFVFIGGQSFSTHEQCISSHSIAIFPLQILDLQEKRHFPHRKIG